MSERAAVILTLREQPSVPLEAESISPDHFAGLEIAKIRALPIFLGKRRLRMEDFFEIDGEDGEKIEIHGDAGKVKCVGRGMTKGSIRILSHAGMHLGAHMRGGTIEVQGNVSDWLGAEMRGGLIRVHGNAGGQIGAAYRGSLSGMNQGTILVDGAAGLEVGLRMRRGIIAIGGPVRDFAGLQMKGGTILLCKGAEPCTGAWMVRGTIISFTRLSLLPTFARACEYQPAFLQLFLRHLQAVGFTLPVRALETTYERNVGDAAVPGKGEILVTAL
jgi:formylmethanofuran dehydrogenase subunit C